ncbi:unnamed protein product [Coregonus sp. 'balchen']|nr:unnamed protein product [Coregonus sp. 'balchen']
MCLNVTAKSVPLTIQRLQMSDSAVYYCALRPTVTTGDTVPLQKLFECTGDNVQQQPGGVIVTEGGLVTLSCQYKTSTNNAYLYWYKQEANDFPKHMLSRYSFGSGDNAAGFKERFDASLNGKKQSVPLMIWRVQLSDSALYYCALQPTVTGNLCTLNGQTIEPIREEVYAPAGSNITLSCTYSSAVSLQWYLQDPGSAPQYILLILHGVGSPSRASGLDPRLSVKLNDEKTRVDLEISSAKEKDSAMYYCALTPTDDITPTSPEEYYLEGSRFKISCYYIVKSDFLLWHRQYSGSAYQFLLYTTVTSKPAVIRAKPEEPRLSVNLNEERTCVDLDISSAEVTDSALY